MTLWGGNFHQEIENTAWQLNSSLSVDRRMAPQDIRGSRSWAKALFKAGLLNQMEFEEISGGLSKIMEEYLSDSFTFVETDEDIHTAVERRLGELIGLLAGKLHTGRSRNDQVVTDFRLWIMDKIPALLDLLAGLKQTLLDKAEEEPGAIFPGYTHLRRGQPILLAHWWLSYFWAITRDVERLRSINSSISVMPLGSGALGGTAFNIDRFGLAEDLGFNSPSFNSLDAVSDRDFAAEILFFAALLGVHISRLAESLILFTSPEFGYFQLSDAYSTGSSLMPQKKNPDIFELARAKSALFSGNLLTLLSLLKGLPSAYDKDLQEDKPPVFNAIDTLFILIPAFNGAIKTLKINRESMTNALDTSMYATDLADYLVRKGVPFRQAHNVAANAIALSERLKTPLNTLSLEMFKSLHSSFNEDVFEIFIPLTSVMCKSSFGGTSPEAVSEQLKSARGHL